jgi:hypothetical protein
MKIGDGEQAEANIWEYAAYVGDIGSNASVVTTTFPSPKFEKMHIAISCMNRGNKWELRLGLGYRVKGDSTYSLDLAGSGPQGRPATLIIDGITYDNTNIEPETKTYEEYKNKIYKAISNSNSLYIDVLFKDERYYTGEIAARFSNFQKDKALSMINRICPYR